MPAPDPPEIGECHAASAYQVAAPVDRRGPTHAPRQLPSRTHLQPLTCPQPHHGPNNKTRSSLAAVLHLCYQEVPPHICETETTPPALPRPASRFRPPTRIIALGPHRQPCLFSVVPNVPRRATRSANSQNTFKTTRACNMTDSSAAGRMARTAASEAPTTMLPRTRYVWEDGARETKQDWMAANQRSSRRW